MSHSPGCAERRACIIYPRSWDDDAFDWIDEYLDFYKVGSGDMTAWPVIAGLARRGKPILLSTGLATLDEVMQTVRYIQSIDGKYTRPGKPLHSSMHSDVTPFPTKMHTCGSWIGCAPRPGLSVGYSDHTNRKPSPQGSDGHGCRSAGVPLHRQSRRQGVSRPQGVPDRRRAQ